VAEDPKLIGVHPELIQKVTKVQVAMASLGFPMKVTEGVRSTAKQQELWAQGRTKPGRIVTKADGVIKKSNHQKKSDGFGYAVDCCFSGPDPYLEHDPLFDAKWNAFGACAMALGLGWGGTWKSPVDRPHVEMKP
jgi:peptidoglycan L-alanyl-D-glutamate endopeptidase CwlK